MTMARDRKPVPSVSGLELLDLFRLLRSPVAGESDRKLSSIAREAGVSGGYLSDILNGKATPWPDIAERIARALGGNDADVASARRYAERAQGETRGGDESAVVGEATRYERWPPAATPVQVLRNLRAPISSLLAAEHQVVDFLGRQNELEELAEWRDADLGPAAVMLIHGSGGEGKTRLAMRFAERSRRWRTVQAVRMGEIIGGRPISPRPAGRTKGVLVVIDYAERWQIQELLERILDDELRGAVPVRLLLIARTAGSWWDVLSTRLRRYRVVTSDLALNTVDRRIDRETVFRTACMAFGRVLGPVDSERIDLPAGIGDKPFGHVLTLQMAALAAVDAASREAHPPQDPGSLTAYLLGRERDHWQYMSERDAQATTPQAMAKAVYVATLAGPLSHSEASMTLAQ
jgi:transcriptional regulator with XRE-family HTH domain